MDYVKDLRWKYNMSTKELIEQFGKTGFQASELEKAAKVFVKMKLEGAKIFLTFTSNMVTSGLRGFFAQVIEKKMADVIVTTIGSIEEDIMKADNAQFPITTFFSDDVALHEKGMNRVGNVLVDNQSYVQFEERINEILQKIYSKKKQWTPSELFREIGLLMNDSKSILYQAAKNNVPIYCPAITDGAFGFHLYLFQQKHPDFIIDIIADFGNILLRYGYDDKKGVIALGGSISKHHALLACLLNGGIDFAVYMTTADFRSGSMSGATTEEAKSWGKVKGESDVATVKGDVSIMFPLAMSYALDELIDIGMLEK